MPCFDLAGLVANGPLYLFGLQVFRRSDRMADVFQLPIDRWFWYVTVNTRPWNRVEIDFDDKQILVNPAIQLMSPGGLHPRPTRDWSVPTPTIAKTPDRNRS
jgi:hypothetical protein